MGGNGGLYGAGGGGGRYGGFGAPGVIIITYNGNTPTKNLGSLPTELCRQHCHSHRWRRCRSIFSCWSRSRWWWRWWIF
jgi:hypothetical protein